MKGIKRINRRSYHGGDYSIRFYLDDNGNAASRWRATNGIEREMRNDGSLVCETFFSIDRPRFFRRNKKT